MLKFLAGNLVLVALDAVVIILLFISIITAKESKVLEPQNILPYCSKIDSGQFPDYRGSFESGCASSYSTEE